jgi:hypothetical protein
MTDAISPEFQLTPTGPGSFKWSEWQIDDDNALMLHEPTRVVFSIYLVLRARHMIHCRLAQPRSSLRLASNQLNHPTGSKH